MHEVSLISNILGLAEAALAPYKITKVNELVVHVGKLSNVIEGALRFAYEAASPSTICRGAGLRLVSEPVNAACQSCGQSFDTYDLPIICPFCQGREVEIKRGTEIFLASIDFEEEES